MKYRTTRDIAIARAGGHTLIRRKMLLDPAMLSSEGLARLVARGYVVIEAGAEAAGNLADTPAIAAESEDAHAPDLVEVQSAVSGGDCGCSKKTPHRRKAN